jgi:Ca2+:H+ antiporter
MMKNILRTTLSQSVYVFPTLAIIGLALSWERSLPTLILLLLGVLLAGSVLAAVHHAEVIAHKVGEPFGSLILAAAVTVIEVGMIVTLMMSSPEESSTLARDTVFSAIMIICNGIVGISLLVKASKNKTAVFKPEGIGGALAAIAALATLTLVLPSFTTSTPGPTYTNIQLGFAAVMSLALYLIFVFVQTIRHRDFFLPPASSKTPVIPESVHSEPPSTNKTIVSVVFLMVALVSVVGLAKVTSPLLEAVIYDAGLPTTLIAVSIAGLVLLPEGISAVRAAYFGRSQTSLNLAYGSGMATIGLTIPVIAVMSIFFGFPITLGLNSQEIVLLFLTIIVSILTVVPGRATIMQGAIHLSLFAAFIFFIINP